MSLPPSNSNSSFAFHLLHEKVKKWIWKKNWDDLRDIQEAAIRSILQEKEDIIISASTAHGKTEAAFLPICSKLVDTNLTGIFALYIGPLKALINDQFERLETLCDETGISVHRWHGDVSQSRKQKLLKSPSGILLITPESLESLFVNHGHTLSFLFNTLEFIVVDELHAFLGTERGKQLQSLLFRLENATGRKIRKIGLSATLSDMVAAKAYLNGSINGVKVISSQSDGADLKLQLRGYIESAPKEEEDENAPKAAPREIAAHLFRTLRGTSNLIFANARRDVESYSDLLRGMSEEAAVPNEFFPHHGSLSRELREDIEAMLKKQTLPLNVVCTSTLELGIDIGRVGSIAQIGTPPSVSSLRQRLGRSGRRGEPAILRTYVTEPELTAKSHLLDLLRPDLFRAAAMIQLMLEKWNETPNLEPHFASTMVQQILSVIAQKGGITADLLWIQLCEAGAFANVSKATFIELLRSLGTHDLIVQSSDSVLLLGKKGERIVNHFSFYAAFQTPEEYRLIHSGNVLGTIPVLVSLTPGSYLIFAGRRWQVKNVNPSDKTIDLEPAKGGTPPKFTGSGGRVHKEIRWKMLELYKLGKYPAYLDDCAQQLFMEGLANFVRFKLLGRRVLASGETTHLILWEGDSCIETLVLLFRSIGMKVEWNEFILSFNGTSTTELMAGVRTIIAQGPPTIQILTKDVPNAATEKYDIYIPETLLREEYAHQNLSLSEAWDVLGKLASELEMIK